MSVRRMARTVVAAILFVAPLLSAPPARAAGPTVLGAGSTWSQIAIDQWRNDVVRMGLSINYQGVGSTQGRQMFASGTVDFGVSEIPYGEGGESLPSRGFKYMPIVAGGTSLMYNVKSPSGQQIRDLTLSPSTIAGIFTGKITKWSDPEIKRDYSKPLPNTSITTVVRSDGSGTSYQFSAFLKAMEPGMWSSFMSACGQGSSNPTSFYPSGPPCPGHSIAQLRSDGVANYIANPGLGNGAIGYVEAGYAIARRFPVVAVKNKSGHYVYPTAINVATALKHAHLNNDSTQELSQVYTASENNAYPISSYSYMIVPTDSSISTAKGQVLGKFIIYFACTGQQQAEKLGYSPLPKELVEFTFDAEKAIPGAPNPPALTAKACPNPTIDGSFYKNASLEPPPGSVTTTVPEEGGGTTGTTGSGTGSASSSTGASGTEGAVASGSTGAVGSGSTGVVTASVAVANDEELAQLKALADEQIQGMPLASQLPLIVGAIVVLLLIFGPLFLRLSGRGHD